jgi:hypothetical protein
MVRGDDLTGFDIERYRCTLPVIHRRGGCGLQAIV